jgi:Tol biopolymer transport system component
MVSTTALLVAALVVISGCGLGGGSSDSEDVVFSVDVEDNIDVYRLDSETNDSVRLTTSAGSDLAPGWSPNKEQIAFISDRNGVSALWLMDSVGESKRQVTEPGIDVVDFRWSPDSVRIAVETIGSGGRSISILDTKTDEIVLLTAQSEDVRVGDWSPDGEWVVYSVNEGADSAIRRRNPTGVDEITLFTGRAVNPRWSRNGQWIAFNRINEDGSVDLAVMDKDGGNESDVATEVNSEHLHDWSPDSKRLVYVTGAGNEAEIFVVGRDGKNEKQLTSNRVNDSAPVWSPDGTAILFLSEGDGSFDIYRMESDGGQQVRITTTDDLVIGADW